MSNDETAAQAQAAAAETQAQTAEASTAPDLSAIHAELAELRQYKTQRETAEAEAQRAKLAEQGEFKALAEAAESRALEAERRAERAVRESQMVRAGITDEITMLGALAKYDGLDPDTRPAFDKWIKTETKEGGALYRPTPQPAGTPRTHGGAAAPEVPDAIVREARRAYERGGVLTKGVPFDEYLTTYAKRRHKPATA